MSLYFTKTFQRSFGTFPLRGEALASALRIAIDIGYRSIDTAQLYENEADVGAALATIDVPRDELLVTTKVHPESFGEDKFLASVEQSLRDLRLDYVDALLVHWPPLDHNIAPSLKLLAKAKAEGLTRHIGVSNYTAKMMHDAVAISEEPVVTNQVEFHPLIDQSILLKAAAETGIPLASYSSVARGEVFKYPIFGEIGAIYGKSAGQVVLRWILQQGISINTMSTKEDNIRANFEIMDFVLSSVDMARISKLTGTNYRVVGSDKVPWAPDWD
ncbi:aldo/keto reductase (plasmid) [Rhizobium sp. RCAM05350]|uniref:aldo/keto reductase n=1 Tax=Rhizobium sp. RCAM05350 TaxID=2895568 RepID=UPI0020768918|nr:aldo/keto reductase [Rhizobium sp. RCAM05350]URK89525.1 aldo/keto reductase [Rhizobium sp. RCAM05350]